MSNNSELVFPPSVRKAQTERGSERLYEKQIQNGYPNTVTPDLAAYIAQLDTAFLATVSENGAPYIQHRGGPKGFIKVVDERTLGFADYRGNRQYITVGNLAGNDRAYLFLLDHANRQRIKIWGRARVVENDDALVAKLFDDGYRAKPERVILFTIDAWDVNCSQHITARFTHAGNRRSQQDAGRKNGSPRGRECAAARATGCAGSYTRRTRCIASTFRPALRSDYVEGSRDRHTMNHDRYDDSYIRGILNTVKTIAMVGVSANVARPSYFAFKYLLERRYRMIPVNPGLAGSELLGQKVYANLAEIPEPVDMVDIFRASQYALGIVKEAIAMNPKPKVIWMQLGVQDAEAAALAEANGMKVVMNRCPKIEYGRLSSEIAWMGVNTRTLTSRRAKILGGGIQRMSLDRATTAGAATPAAERAYREG